MVHVSPPRKVIIFACGLLALGAAAGGGLLLGRHQPFARSGIEAYIHHRFDILRMKALDAPKGQALLIGDSLSDGQSIETVCGLRVFNAGVSGSRLGDWETHGPALAEALEPRLVVIALGTNDAVAGRWPGIDRWQASYRDLLGRIGERHLILVAPPSLDGAGDARDRVALEQMRAAILALAAPGVRTAAPSFEGHTYDQIHPDPVGRRTWRGAIEAACPSTR